MRTPLKQQCKFVRSVRRAAQTVVRGVESGSEVPSVEENSEPQVTVCPEDRTVMLEPSFARTLVAHWTGRTKEIPVPKTWLEAHSIFWLHPTPIVAVLVLCGLTVLRSGSPVSPVLDALLLTAGVVLWICQEWCVN